jgi:REP element-mobilizing transposase RayT
MDDYESLSHTRWECKYHIVFIAKYRGKVREFTAPAELRLQAAKTAAPLVHPALAVTAHEWRKR